MNPLEVKAGAALILISCIVSGDSNVQPAVEWIALNRPGIRITVYLPALPSEQNQRRTDY